MAVVTRPRAARAAAPHVPPRRPHAADPARRRLRARQPRRPAVPAGHRALRRRGGGRGRRAVRRRHAAADRPPRARLRAAAARRALGRRLDRRAARSARSTCPRVPAVGAARGVDAVRPRQPAVARADPPPRGRRRWRVRGAVHRRTSNAGRADDRQLRRALRHPLAARRPARAARPPCCGRAPSISVRDGASSRFLANAGIEHDLAPDAVHAVNRLWPGERDPRSDVADRPGLARRILAELGLRASRRGDRREPGAARRCGSGSSSPGPRTGTTRSRTSSGSPPRSAAPRPAATSRCSRRGARASWSRRSGARRSSSGARCTSASSPRRSGSDASASPARR